MRARVSPAGLASRCERGACYCLQAVLPAVTSKMETGSVKVGGGRGEKVSSPEDLKTFFPPRIILSAEQEVWE